MKKIAVFGDTRMALEALTRFDKESCVMIYAAQNRHDAEMIGAAGFVSEVIDFRDDSALHRLGIGVDIDYLFCFFPADSDNVFLALSARALDKNLNIISTVDDPDSTEKLSAAGANKIIDPYEISGRKTYEILTKPEITHILDQSVHRRHNLNIAEIEIPEGSWLENRKTSALKLNERHNLILLGVVDREIDDELHFAVGDKEHILNSGDILVVMGPAREIKAFKEALMTRHSP
jgi:voltage-gated potassium channel